MKNKFETKLIEAKSGIEVKKALIQAERTTLKELINIIDSICELCGLDQEKMVRRISVAKKSEYGRINGLLNLLASLVMWPAEQGDGASVSTNQKLITDTLNVDIDLLEDIKSFRGYHTFVSDELEIIDGVEPNYEDYSDYCHIFLEGIELAPSRVVLDESKWQNAEKRAKVRAETELKEMEEAVANHKLLMGEA